MGAHQDARRELINANGRPMTLRRSAGEFGAQTHTDVTLLAFSRAYRPAPLVGSLSQADLVLEILGDEIAAASWPAPPAKGDFVVDGDATYAVTGADAVHEGPDVIGYRLLVRGS